MKRKQRWLSLLLSVALLIGVLPIGAAASSGLAMQMGTDAVRTGDKVYYGEEPTYDGEQVVGQPVPWRVLSKHGSGGTYSDGTNAVDADDALFILALQDMFPRVEYNESSSEDTRDYATSQLRTYYSDEPVGIHADSPPSNYFTEQEWALLLETSKPGETSDWTVSCMTGDYYLRDPGLSGDRLFSLSANELTDYLGITRDPETWQTVIRNDWWLRSDVAEEPLQAGIVSTNGMPHAGGKPLPYVAALPAANINQNDVLFVSAALGGKSAAGMDAGLTPLQSYDGDEWKMTLKDLSRDFSVSRGQIDGSTVTFTYAGAKTEENEYISAILLENGEITYYGRILKVQSESGTVSVTLPAGVSLQGNTELYLFNEQYNGDYETDYASELCGLGRTLQADSEFVWTGDTVYFGEQANGEPRAWQVLSENGNGGTYKAGVNAVSADDALFLLAQNPFAKIRFSFDETAESAGYLTSQLRAYLSDQLPDEEGRWVSDDFSSAEWSALLQTTKEEDFVSLYGADFPDEGLQGDRLFAPSAVEMVDYLGYRDMDWDSTVTGAFETVWWLRSRCLVPGNEYNGVIYDTGRLGLEFARSTYAARPAVNLNRNSVLFTSAAEGGKASGSTGEDALTPISAYTGTAWKLTLRDDSRDFSVSDVQMDGLTVSFAYAGANTGDNEYISVILKENGVITHYGRILQPTSAAGTASVTLPADAVLHGDSELYVFSEQYNGDKRTDYASALQPIALQKTLQTGTAVIGDGDTVYYGTDGRAWQVLSTSGSGGVYRDGTGVVAENDALFLLAQNEFAQLAFANWGASGKNSYLESQLRAYYNGQTDALTPITESFAAAEWAAVLQTSKVPSETTLSESRTFRDAGLEGDRLFALSAEELLEYLAYTDDSASWTGGLRTGNWWLRSAYGEIGADEVGVVYPDGAPYSSAASERSVLARPAMNINRGAVLFTASAEGGKASGSTGADALTPVSGQVGNAWKLTLLDATRSFAVAESESTALAGETVSLHYTGANVGENEYISACLTDGEGNIRYYGRVLQPQTADGEVQIALPAGLPDDDYTLWVFSEQYNGDKQTDFASAPVAVSLPAISPTPAGDGTSSAPYRIFSANQLRAFASLVNTGDSDAWAVLEKDIDLNPGFTFQADGSYTGEGEPQQWTAIAEPNNPYTGVFDGQGKTIRGLYISNENNNQGLFGALGSEAVLKNLTLANGSVQASRYVAAFTANNSGLVENCRNTLPVTATGVGTSGLSGGIAGANHGTITACGNEGTVQNAGNSTRTGGLVGINSGTITNGYNLGAVSAGFASQVGGIAAQNNGSIEACYSIGSVAGGGIAGANSGEVASCYYLEGSAAETQGAAALTASQMTGEAAKENMALDFSGVWAIRPGSTTSEEQSDTSVTIYKTDYYPYLQAFGEETAAAYESQTTETRLPEAEDTPEGEKTYLIYTADQLREFAALVNGTLSAEKQAAYGVQGAVPDANAKLMADIDLNPGFTFQADGSYTGEGEPQQWTAIGSTASPYTGTFDGGAHTITGLYIQSEEKDGGLFRSVGEEGVVQNVNVTNAYICASGNLGGIAGRSSGTLENCAFSGTIIGGGSSAYLGGIVGTNNSGAVRGCTSAGLITTKDEPYTLYLGGIAGWGILGTIADCRNTASVTVQSGVRSVSLGGIVGYHSGVVENCQNAGDVTAGDQITVVKIGGISGLNYGAAKNCYNTGSVTSMGAFANIGGVAGYNNSTMESCYSIGTVTAATGEKNVYAGGFVGQNFRTGVLTNCYYLDTCGASGEGTALSAEQMRGEAAKTAMTGLDFDAVWAVRPSAAEPVGETATETTVRVTYYYPYLRTFGEETAHPAGTAEVQRLTEETVDGLTAYNIYTADQLREFAALVNGTLSAEKQAAYGVTGSARGANARLMADIDLNPGFTFRADGSYTGEGEPQQWTPIGSMDTRYAGVFDGQRHVIRGLYIPDGGDCQGLFGCTGILVVRDEQNEVVARYTAEVRDVALANGFVRGQNHVGGISGYNFGGTITHCSNAAFILGEESTGGIAGYQATGQITECYNTGAVQGNKTYGGGIVGYNRSTIENCYNIAAVGADSGYAGGIAGHNGGSGAIRSCYNTGDIAGGHSNGTGGITGFNAAILKNCYYLETTAQSGAGDLSSAAGVTALTLAQIESKQDDGLLALLRAANADVWNDTLSALGQWEAGSPAVQPVLHWQQTVQNAPTYVVTIPATVTVHEQNSFTVLATAGALTSTQKVEVAVSANDGFYLTHADDSAVKLPYVLKNGTETIQNGGVVLETGNTSADAPARAALAVEPEAARYAGLYTGTLTFVVRLHDAA